MPPSPQQYVANLHNRLTRANKPRTLYHYTSGSGLLGIIETKSIWATNVRYLNDSKEYALAVDITEMILRYRQDHAKVPFQQALYQVMRESLKQIEATEVLYLRFPKP